MSATLEYYDTGSSSWKELDFKVFKLIRQPKQVLETTLPNNQKGNISDNTEIRLKINGTQRFVGITRDGGEFNDEGEINLKVFGFLHDISAEETSSNLQSGITSTTNEGVMQELVNGLGTTSSGNSFSLTAGSSDTYSISDYSKIAKNSEVISEMNDDYQWQTYMQGDYTIYYEPIGYLSSGEIVDISSDNYRVQKWQPNKTDDIVSKVRAIGKDSNGNKISSTRTLSDIGESADTDRFKRLRVDYATTTTELQNIAEQNLDWEKNDFLKIETFWYETNLVNELITIQDPDNLYGIGTTDFVVEKQIDFYPERKSVLYLSSTTKQPQSKWTYKQHRRELETRKERASQITSATESVSDGTSGSLEADNHPHNQNFFIENDHGHLQNSPSQSDHDHSQNYFTQNDHTHNVNATSESGGGGIIYGNYEDFNTTLNSDGSWTLLASPTVPSGSGLIKVFQVEFYDITEDDDLEFLITNDIDTCLLKDFIGTCNPHSGKNNSYYLKKYWVYPSTVTTGGDEVRFYMNYNGSIAPTVEGTFNIHGLDFSHKHNVDETDGAEGGQASFDSANSTVGDQANISSNPDTDGNTTNPTDANSTENNNANVSGSTGSKDINITEENKDDRG